MLTYRPADHCGYVRNGRLEKATGGHFYLPGHSLADLTVIILEQSKRNNDQNRKQRKEYHINRFNTFHKDINRQNKFRYWGRGAEMQNVIFLTPSKF